MEGKGDTSEGLWGRLLSLETENRGDGKREGGVIMTLKISIASSTLSYLHFHILALFSYHPVRTQDFVPFPDLEMSSWTAWAAKSLLTRASSCWMGHMVGTGAARNEIVLRRWRMSDQGRDRGKRNHPAWPWRPWGSISQVPYE